MNAYMEKYPARINVRMTDEDLEELQRFAAMFQLSTAGVVRVSLKLLFENPKRIIDELYSGEV
jgi:hypothetical protein